jgi:hypothetical protein
MPVSAAVIANSQVTTTIASINMTAKFSGTASSDGFKYSSLMIGNF